jgi:predicted DCC family thiol-disulfide oxidoreductase YuxK
VKLKYLVALIVAGTAMIVVPALFHRRAPRTVKRFFSEPGSALDLAVFRVVLFGALLWFFPPGSLLYFSTLPRALLSPPLGTAWLVAWLPINPTVAAVSYGVFVAGAAAALIGWHTRGAAALATVSGLYVLGVPQLYGKINHYHHVLWFAAILAASPCGDALSVDAIRRRWRRHALPVQPTAPVSLAYAVPLRFVWLLMGMIYFWAGTWKLWTEGWTWAFSDNLKFAMYAKWLELGGWTPVIRIDRHDTLCHLLAAYTIVFEIAFVFLIVFPWGRALAALLGLGFHRGTSLFMQIGFATLEVCYVAFVSWAWLLRRVGQWLYPARATLWYDGECSSCRRAIVVIQELDVLGRVDYRNLREASGDAADIVLETGRGRVTGFDAYRALAWRVPPFWPLLPLLALPPIRWAGERTYRAVADHRRCRLDSRPSTDLPPARTWRPAAAVGACLVYVLVLASIAKYHSWPFTAYPTFEDLLTRPEVTVLYLEAETADGRAVRQDALRDRLLPKMPPERYHALLARALTTTDPQARLSRFNALWCTAVRERPALATLRHVTFHQAVVSTRPEDWGAPPLRVSRLAEFPPTDCGRAYAGSRGDRGR